MDEDEEKVKHSESNIIDFESLRKTSFDNASVDYNFYNDYDYDFWLKINCKLKHFSKI